MRADELMINANDRLSGRVQDMTERLQKKVDRAITIFWNKMKGLVKFLWQLPQNLIGLLLVMVVRADTIKRVDGKRIWYSERMKGAVTLGEYIVINMDKYYSSPTSTERHEIGHYKQSLIFGWLYLFIIGIPSIIHCSLHKGGNYGHFYTEMWADEVEELKIPMVWLSVVLHLVVIFTILLLV